jgi:hypothetical protein
MVQPALIKQYPYIFILLDDCKLTGSSVFPLDKIIDIMKYNKLTVASPMVVGANRGGGQLFRTIMQREPVPNTLGYTSTFVEIFAWITTYDAYKALWQLLCPHINPFAWGYDFWYDNYAQLRVKGHKMGVISSIKVIHDQNISSDYSQSGRTDSTSIEVKWQAVLSQEKYYARNLGIPLRKYRTKLRLFNDSWNGAVTGYILSPYNIQKHNLT